MKYHDWAPRTLVALHKQGAAAAAEHASAIAGVFLLRTSHLLDGGEAYDLLERLITDPRMQEVWTILIPHFSFEPLHSYRFVFACQEGIQGWRQAPRLTAQEYKKDASKVAKEARRLAEILRGSQAIRAESVWDYLVPYLECCLEKEIEEIVKAASIGDKKPFIRVVRRIGNKHARFTALIKEELPSLEIFLDRVSEKAEGLAKSPVPVSRAHAKEATQHYFIKTFSSYLRRYYPKLTARVLYEIVAITTDVALKLPVDAQVSSDSVRKLIRATQ